MPDRLWPVGTRLTGMDYEEAMLQMSQVSCLRRA